MTLFAFSTRNNRGRSCGEQNSSLSDQTPAHRTDFVQGDKISCLDDVAAAEILVKFTSTNPLKAYIAIEPLRGTRRFYSADLVRIATVDSEIELSMTHANGWSESVQLSPSILSGAGGGVYADGGDSRGKDCTLKSVVASTGPATYTQIAQLDQPAVNDAVKNQGAQGMPASLNAALRDSRMARDYAKLVQKVRRAAGSRELADALESGINIKVFQVLDEVAIYVEGPADDRSSSNYSFVIEVNARSNAVKSWGAIEFSDHP
jgi:hypothetical protein